MNAAQLGFEDLLASASQANARRRFERETGHLPGTEEALPFYRGLIDRHHAAMLCANAPEAMRIRDEAHALALRLSGADPAILEGAGAPGRALERLSAAAEGSVPLWGQTGVFCVTACDMRVRVAMEGMFGIGMSAMHWPGFSAHAVDRSRPFLSETGYRSFLGIHAEIVPGLTPTCSP